MQTERGNPTPLDRVNETLDERVIEGLEVISDEVRMAILLALWEESDPFQRPWTPPKLSFSELRERVGVLDSGRFNYHLDKISGVFIEQTDEGYKTLPAASILNPLMGRRLNDSESVEERIDAECRHCGNQLEMTHEDHFLDIRCTECAGEFSSERDPSGMVAGRFIPPGARDGRTTEELHRHANVWSRTAEESLFEGFCPQCAGTVTQELYVCSEHNSEDNGLCEDCGSRFEISWLFVCDVCKFASWGPAWHTLLYEQAVLSFFHNHGLDLHELYDTCTRKPIYDALKDVSLTDGDSPGVKLSLELDDDRLDVTFDEEACLTDVTKVSD